MRNISNFEKIPKRGWLFKGDGLVSNKFIFEWMREPVQITNDFYDAGVLVGLWYRTHSISYSVSGDWVPMCAREFCILCSLLRWVSGTTKSN